jgi:hypothetical protein
MNRRSRTVLLCAWSTAFLACAVWTIRITRNMSARADQNPNQARPAGKPTSLSLQPEAFNLSRRLGNRFIPSRQSSATIVGTLTTGGVAQNVNITRRQTPTGEDVALRLAGQPGTLAWNDLEGARTDAADSSEAQQTLIERVALDNPDQFVLAQLRGASYYTVARNVRADTGGSENYSGPLWDIVRIDENPGAQRLSGNSRLYYVNTQTRLIDKIVSELKGEPVEANILEWSDQSGEKFPSHIAWKRGNKMVQEFRLTSVSVRSQQ